MRWMPLFLIVLLVRGCATGPGTSEPSEPRAPLLLRPDFRPTEVRTVSLVLDFPDPEKLSRDGAEAFVDAVKRETERRWSVREEARVLVRRPFDFGARAADVIGPLELEGGEDWIVVAQLNARHTFASAPEADFGETGGLVLRDGTRIPNPTICMVVTVQCALLDARRPEVVWRDKREAGPVVDGRPMDHEHMTPELVSRMTEAVFGSLP
jgi:hypothetical protein